MLSLLKGCKKFCPLLTQKLNLIKLAESDDFYDDLKPNLNDKKNCINTKINATLLFKISQLNSTNYVVSIRIKNSLFIPLHCQMSK